MRIDGDSQVRKRKMGHEEVKIQCQVVVDEDDMPDGGVQ
jgi:hypothetical protein